MSQSITICTKRNDTVHGSYLDETIWELAGDDHIQGRSGNDFLMGGKGSDHLKGGLGDDQIYGGSGNDVLGGGLGIDLISGGSGDDYIRTVDFDIIFGGGGFDRVEFAMNDSPYSFHAIFTEVLDGTGLISNYTDLNGIEAVVVYGTDQADTVGGTHEDDVLWGYSGNDNLSGDAGNDVLRGEMGDDRLEGGLGNDRFLFLNTGDGGADTIYLFVQGEDKIDLSSFGLTFQQVQEATTVVDSYQQLIDMSQFTGVAGDQILVYGLYNHLSLTASDFIL